MDSIHDIHTHTHTLTQAHTHTHSLSHTHTHTHQITYYFSKIFGGQTPEPPLGRSPAGAPRAYGAHCCRAHELYENTSFSA